MVDRLPTESATKTKMRDVIGDEELARLSKAHADDRSGHGPLSRTDLILFDVLDQLRWIDYAIYASQGAKPRRPEPTPRPGLVDEKTKTKQAAKAPLDHDSIRHLTLLRSTRERD